MTGSTKIVNLATGEIFLSVRELARAIVVTDSMLSRAFKEARDGRFTFRGAEYKVESYNPGNRFTPKPKPDQWRLALEAEPGLTLRDLSAKGAIGFCRITTLRDRGEIVRRGDRYYLPQDAPPLPQGTYRQPPVRVFHLNDLPAPERTAMVKRWQSEEERRKELDRMRVERYEIAEQREQERKPETPALPDSNTRSHRRTEEKIRHAIAVLREEGQLFTFGEACARFGFGLATVRRHTDLNRELRELQRSFLPEGIQSYNHLNNFQSIQESRAKIARAIEVLREEGLPFTLEEAAKRFGFSVNFRSAQDLKQEMLDLKQKLTGGRCKFRGYKPRRSKTRIVLEDTIAFFQKQGLPISIEAVLTRAAYDLPEKVTARRLRKNFSDLRDRILALEEAQKYERE